MVIGPLKNKLQWNCHLNLNIVIQENTFGNVVCKMAAILSRPQWVDIMNTVDLLRPSDTMILHSLKRGCYFCIADIMPTWTQYYAAEEASTGYLVFYNPSSPRMFLSLDLLWEYRIQHSANGPLYVTSSNSTWIFCRGVSGFATDCPCGVWCRGLTTCLLHVGPPFRNQIINNSWAVGLT